MSESQNREYKSSWHDALSIDKLMYYRIEKGARRAKKAQIPIIAEILQTALEEDMGGFMVKLFKDRFSKEQLEKLGLNNRQMKAVEYIKTKGKITNAEYQEINNVSKRTATNDLSELVEQYKLLNNTGFGAGSYYELIIGQ